jgi:molybdopterin/thiamine biosynthesis adenylyltransferase/TusA-related sulfurtransferase
MRLSEQQIERYSRNIILENVGEAGQEKLLSSKVLIVGAGGLGSPAAFYLAAAGVGTIGIADGDKVDPSNLQRQIIHRTADVGVDKVISAENKIREINPDIKVRTHNLRARANNIGDIIKEYDFIVDATDNFTAKFLINDACYFERVPYSHAGVLEFDGQLITVLPGQTACYRCIFNSPPPPNAVPSCSQVGVLGVLPGVIGSLQATEAIKYLLGIGDLLTNTLLTYNALTMKFRKVRLNRNPDCPVCGSNPRITELKEEELFSSPDSNHNFRDEKIIRETDLNKIDAKSHIIDLRGLACPLNFVKAKLELEKLGTGSILEVLLDEGEPIRNVPDSFIRQGQDIIEIKNLGEYSSMKVRRNM